MGQIPLMGDIYSTAETVYLAGRRDPRHEQSDAALGKPGIESIL